MTSKLTRLTDDELTETLRQATSGYPLPASVEGNLRHAFAELQERRKADSKPVAWKWRLVDLATGDPGKWRVTLSPSLPGKGMGYRTESSPLYRHAQAAPVVPEIDRKAIADKVYGKCSRIPGATFYNAAEFAIDEMEACRAAMLQASNSPVIPDGYVMVPKEATDEMIAAAMNCDDVSLEYHSTQQLRERIASTLRKYSL